MCLLPHEKTHWQKCSWAKFSVLIFLAQMPPRWVLITWIISWLTGDFVGSLSCTWWESRRCLRARTKTLLLPHSFWKLRRAFWLLVVILTQTSSSPLPHLSVTLTKYPLWANLTELVLWVCNNDFPETPRVQSGTNLAVSAWPSGNAALLVLKLPTLPEMLSKSLDMESCSVWEWDSPQVPQDLLWESQLVLCFLTKRIVYVSFHGL